MRFNKVVTATLVLTVSCVAAAAYTAVHDDRVTAVKQVQNIQTDAEQHVDFVSTLIQLESGLFDIDIKKTNQAYNELTAFYQEAEQSLNAPLMGDAQSIKTFMAQADRLIKENFPVTNDDKSVTESLVTGERNHQMNTWLLLGLARQNGLNATLTAFSDHNDIVLKTSDEGWVEWKVGHILDTEKTELLPLDEYDLWTAFDLSIVRMYIDNGYTSNDDSIEALAKAAVLDNENDLQAQTAYSDFLKTRNRESELAILLH